MTPYTIELHPFTNDPNAQPGAAHNRVLAVLADGPMRLIAGIGEDEAEARASLATACVRALGDDSDPAPPALERIPAELRPLIDAAMLAAPQAVHRGIKRRGQREDERRALRPRWEL